MQNRNVLWLLILILIIATFFRFYHLTQTPPGLYPDEAMNGNNALEALRTGQFKVYYPENNGREGLMMNIQALSLWLFKTREPWVLRFPNALFGVLTVLGMYFLGKELLSRRVGLLAAFFTAVNLWHLNFSRMSFRANLAPFFMVWALYFFCLALRKIEERMGYAHIWFAIAGGVMFGLGFHSYIAYRIMPLVFLAFLPFYGRNKNFWKVTGIFVAATFVAALPIGIYYLAHPADFFGRTSEVSIFSTASPLKELALNTAKTIGMFFWHGDWNWRHNYSGSPELFWPVAALFALGIGLALKNFLKRAAASYSDSDRNLNLSFALIFTWFALAFLPVVISSEGIPHALRSILMIPPVMLLAGVGGAAAFDYLRRFASSDLALNIGAALFFAFLIWNGWQAYFVLWANDPNTAAAFNAQDVELGRTLENLPVNTPKYVIVEARGVDVRGLPMPTQTVMFMTDTFDPKMAAAKNIHYVLPNQESSVPPGALKFYLR